MILHALFHLPEILMEALNLHEGEKRLNEGYFAFRNLSIGNQILAVSQLSKIGPIKTYKQWLEMGRQVKKGSKAISLRMPVQVKQKDVDGNPVRDADGKPVFKQVFVLRKNWFSIHDTEGDSIPEPDFPEWNCEKAMKTLGINQEDYQSIKGNAQGYATIRSGVPVIAISPVAKLPSKTRFHEIGHHVLGHLKSSSSEILSDKDDLSKDAKEVEAECVAFLCCAFLGLEESLAYSRTYILSWMKDCKPNSQMASRIFKAVDKILEAGLPPKEPRHA